MYQLCLLEGDGEVTGRYEEEAGNRESYYKVVQLGLTESSINHLDMRSRRAEVKETKKRLFGDT